MITELNFLYLVSNGSPPRTPETTSKKYGGTYSTPVLQIKGLKSASEPNLSKCLWDVAKCKIKELRRGSDL